MRSLGGLLLYRVCGRCPLEGEFQGTSPSRLLVPAVPIVAVCRPARRRLRRRACRIPRAGVPTERQAAIVRSGRSRRTPPGRPTGAPRAAEATASAIARSAPGSSIRTPPATLTNTSALPSRTPAWRVRTATIIASRFGSTPVATRRGIARSVGATAPAPRVAADECLRARSDGRPIAPTRPAEQLRGVGDADEAAARHLEDSELVRRPEPILGRAKHAVRVVAIAFELQHAVDEVLEHPRPRNRSVLRHVADEDGRDTDSLATRRSREAASRTCPRPERIPARTVERLPSRSRRRRDAHAQGRADDLELRLGEDLDPARAAEPVGPELDLRRGLLPVTRSARRPEDAAAPSADRSNVDLPTPGSPPTSTSDAGTMPPPSTRSSSATPVRIRCASSAFTSARRSGSAHDRPRQGRRPVRSAPRRACRTRAARATTEPAPRGRAALVT